jgi:PPE-repeat protein
MGVWGDAAALPPELNHTLHSMGDLGESLMQAAAGHEMVADMLIAEMTAMGLNTSTTAMVAWQGPGGVMMQMSAQEFIEVCALASMWARMSSTQAAEVVAAHSTALQSMVPAEVSLANRTTYAGLAASNLLGQNTPAMMALDAQYYGVFWTNNATQRSAYGGAATSALGAITEPAPFSPTAADPAGPAAAVAQDAGSEAGEGGFQAGAQSMGDVADGGGMSGSMGSQFSSMLGSAVQPLASAGQSLPSMATQAPQMFSGLLGPLTSSMNGLNGSSAAASLAPEAAGAAGLPGALGGAGALGGGGGGGLVSGSSALSSTFVRPASSFSPPTAPTLPGGWQGGDKETSVQARPAGVGGGGLYGAPPGAMGRESGGAESERSSRTLQVTARQGSSRGEKNRI